MAPSDLFYDWPKVVSCREGVHLPSCFSPGVDRKLGNAYGARSASNYATDL